MSDSTMSIATEPLPLEGIRVLEFTHMVMGPTCGMILADLGGEVIKIEPLNGDNTRRLIGSGAGFFPMFNRNKKSLAVDVKHPKVGNSSSNWLQAQTSLARTSKAAPWTVLVSGVTR